jgi:spermidine/putrescine transport system permease protein
MNDLRTRITLPFLIFVTPVLVWLFLLIVLPHIDLLLMSFRTETIPGPWSGAWSTT